MAYPNQPAPPPPQTMGSSNTVFITETRFDLSYLTTPSGIIKAVILVFNIIGFICIMSSAFRSNGRGVYFCILVVFAFFFTGAILILYLYHAVEKYHNVKWLKIEMIAYTTFVFLYLIAATIAVAFGSAAYSAAGFFAYLTMVLYGIDAFLKVRALKDGQLAQGHRTVTKQVHMVTPPALP
ncbi:plasmolipin-like [Plodia interpunctella]|uniref:plasmolipin-like n=1 Tax=Plodia interpunctella TaxID=58824 RepID=UPI002368D0C3|nr:plasmolipin-like [Plodia interpunctella]